MINVLHIHTLPIISGSGINTFLSMKGIHGKEFKVDLACAPGGRLVEMVRTHGMNVITFKNMVQPLHPLKDLLITFGLFAYLRKNKYQIVHTHNSKAGFVGRLAAKIAGVPVIIHTVHGFAFHDQEPFWRRALFRNLERLASNWCDKIIFISQPLIDWALKERICRADKIVKIYSGIDLKHFSPMSYQEENRLRKKWNIDKKERAIGIVSKLWEGKGHDVLINAFNIVKHNHNNLKLVIVGEGYLENELKKKVQDLGIEDSVIFTGFQSNVAEILACIDISVLPSYFEGMGRVILEAMAMEKPVIASNVGGIPELVKNDINGILMSPGDVDGLAKGLNRLLNNEDLARTMGKNGREMIKDMFSSETMVSRIRNLYIHFLSKKGIKFGD